MIAICFLENLFTHLSGSSIKESLSGYVSGPVRYRLGTFGISRPGPTKTQRGVPNIERVFVNDSSSAACGRTLLKDCSSIYDNCQEVLIIVFRLQPQALVGTMITRGSSLRHPHGLTLEKPHPARLSLSIPGRLATSACFHNRGMRTSWDIHTESTVG